jgi:hypothetical protein
MRCPHAGLVAVLVVILASLVTTQTPPASPMLPESLRTHLRDEQYVAVASVAALSKEVRDGLRDLFGAPTLGLAEPGAEYQATDVMLKPNLPTRRLIRAGCSADHCLVYYERGGIAHTWHVVVFQLRESGARFEWGGSAPWDLRDLDQVRSAILTGAVKGQTTYF